MSNVCPVCKCTETTDVEASSASGYGSLVVSGIGGVRLEICIACGAVFLGQADLQEVQKHLKKKKSRR